MHADKQAPVSILHHGLRYRARLLRCSDAGWAVVHFEHWRPQPCLAEPSSAESFFVHRGINAICIVPARNDWFQHAEMGRVVDAIRRAARGLRLVGYGGSMGGFAALAFSESLGLDSVVAVCPQVSIDPALAPFEQRWPHEAAAIAEDGGFSWDGIEHVAPLRRGWLIYDPATVDGLHAARITARHGIGEVRLRLGGHAPMLALQQGGLYTAMLTDMLTGHFDLPRFRQAWRPARRRSAVYWIGLSYWLRRRGQFAGARQAALRARTLPHPEPAAIDMMQAEAELRLGRVEEARQLAEPWVSDPVWGETARWCLREAVLF